MYSQAFFVEEKRLFSSAFHALLLDSLLKYSIIVMH